jgi:hypothetical protein
MQDAAYNEEITSPEAGLGDNCCQSGGKITRDFRAIKGA